MNHVSENLLSRFGSADERVRRAVESVRRGRGVIVVDDESRENEGDIIFPADCISVEQMSLLIRQCSGIVCLILTEDQAKKLDLCPMVSANTSRFGTNFTVSIEAREGVTTGVSAADRVTTIRAAIADGCCPADLARPGHVFPIVAHPGGLAARGGHSEATIALMQMAGRKSAGVLCEVMRPDGAMARLPELVTVAERLDLPLVSVQDLLAAEELAKVA